MTPSAPRPALTPEREKELLGLIEAYWRIVRPASAICFRTSGWKPDAQSVMSVAVRPPNTLHDETVDYPASWAESEACLREVAGEVIVRGVNVNVLMCSAYITRKCGEDHVEGKDESRPVALLRAFVAAFGSEPRHE